MTDQPLLDEVIIIKPTDTIEVVWQPWMVDHFTVRANRQAGTFRDGFESRHGLPIGCWRDLVWTARGIIAHPLTRALAAETWREDPGWHSYGRGLAAHGRREALARAIYGEGADRFVLDRPFRHSDRLGNIQEIFERG